MLRLSRRLPFALVVGLLLLAGCSSSQPAATDSTAAAEPAADGPADAPVEGEAAAGNVAEDVADAPAPVAPVPDAAPQDWHLLTPARGVMGIGVARAYDELLAGRTPARDVVVAIIDSGTDIEHEDLRGRLWTNDDEVPGNGADDDGNGYADDVHGWNFIGGPDGQNVHHDTLELTRLVASMQDTYASVDPDTLTTDEEAAYARYQELRRTFERKRREMRSQVANIGQAADVMTQARATLQDALGTKTLTVDAVRKAPQNGQVGQARRVWLYFRDEIGITQEELDEAVTSIESRLDYGYNLDFNPRPIVGDDYDDPTERFYGNSDVVGPDPSHGTVVAGIAAAERGNGLGINGIAPARIMVVRAVPDGDERDKDVANAIRYAVDNGAHVINMSFGKGYSPRKAVVDAAVRYADERGVLMVHAAGNSAADIDTEPNFPSSIYAEGARAARWLEVGASSWKRDALAASFSNYGDERVDLFAPGTEIYAPEPSQQYGRSDGTSMAAPVVTGVAALLMAYFPDLDAAAVRQLILDTATRYDDLSVPRPTTEGPAGAAGATAFCTLSATCGVVDAYAAVEAALAREGGTGAAGTGGSE